MKNIFYTLCLMAVSAMTFVACEDVPEPYDTFQEVRLSTKIPPRWCLPCLPATVLSKIRLTPPWL